MINFDFATASRILFGVGALDQVGSLAAEMGRRALVVTGANPTRATPLLERLATAGVEAVSYPVAGEPTIEMIQAGVEQARGAACELVIGFGGGSALDAGKAIAALMTNEGEPLDYLEVIGRARPLEVPPAPYIAIPTTAGTGAEVTRNAVLASPEHQVKVSLRSPLMLPRLALVDPALTYSVPPAVTASTGMDALTQNIEPFVSHRANAMTDLFCREGIRLAARSLRRAYEQGEDPVAREEMALASLFGGLALANAKLGAVHGFAGPLGGMFPAPHGALCAALLAPVTRVNLQALQARAPEGAALRRYEEVARLLTDDPDATAEEGAGWIEELAGALAVPGLARYGVTERAFPAIIEKSAASSSMRGNPIPLTEAEMGEILKRAL